MVNLGSRFIILVNLDFAELDRLDNILWSGGIFGESGDLPNRPYISNESCSSSMCSATTTKPHKGCD
jgi:hypothetical protein